MATANKDQQVKHAVEGVALGVLAAGVGALTSTKMALELSFNQAWRRWSPAANFPSLRGPDPGNLFWGGLHRSAGRKWAFAAWENDRRWVRPYLRDGWSLDELDECLENFADERASVNDWREFGCLYVERFEPDEKISA